jgi:hypothetical protein
VTAITIASADGVATVQAPAEGPWPIWSTETLLARVLALPDSSVLAEVWVNRGWPSLQATPLLDQATFHAIEREIAHWEEVASSIESGQLRGWEMRLAELPAHVKDPAFEQIATFTGTTRDDLKGMGHGNVTTVGRLPIIRDIVERALGLADAPGPTERQAEADAAELAEAQAGGYPGSKAKIEDVKAWIGDPPEPNRLARALAQELDRSTPRVRLVKWLETELGEERLAAVHEAMAGAKAPPLAFRQIEVTTASDPIPTTIPGQQVPAPDAPQGIGEGQEDGEGEGPPAASPEAEGMVAQPPPPPPSEPDVTPRQIIEAIQGKPTDTSPIAGALRLAGEALIAAAKAMEDAA